MIKLHKSGSIKYRIIRYNFMTICIIAIFVSMYSYMTASKKTIEIAKNSLTYQVNNISYRYQTAYEEMLNIILNCTGRKNFDLASQGKSSFGEVVNKGLKYLEVLKDYCAITGYGEYISRLAIFNDNGVLIQTGTSMGSNDDAARMLDTPWFETELLKSIDAYHLETVPSPFYSDRVQVLPIVRTLSGTDDPGKGWIMLCLSSNLFQDVLNETDTGQETIVVTSRGSRIASINELEKYEEENNRILQQLLQQEENKGLFQQKLHGEDYLIAYERYVRSGILVYSNMPLRKLTHDKQMMIQTIILMFLSCLVVGMVLSVIFTNQVKKPIDHLVNHIRRIATGNFIEDKSLESKDEIGIIGKVVNDMSRQIGSLMDQRIEDEKEKSHLELKMLQAQINPHFLYNTLDSIKWIAVIQKNSGIVKVVTALSGLLKNMAKGFNEKVTLKTELDFLYDYVTIERVKYVELFDLVVDVADPKLYDALVIKLTLQPLVENAIFNGIEPSGKNGIITIRIYEEDGNLYITIRDNGKGIQPDKLISILQETERVKSDRMSGIGLPNVERRIKLTYGNDYGLTIESEVERFTQIRIKMPLEYG